MSEPALSVADGVAQAPALVLRGVGPQLILDLDPAAPFERLREEIRATFGEDPARFKGSSVRLAFGSRELSLFDLRRLVHLFKDEFDVLVTGIYVTPDALHRYAEQELKLKVYLADAPEAIELTEEVEVTDDPPTESEPASVTRFQVLPPAPEPPDALGAHRMLPVERTIRSGATVRFSGDVVVYGDVNAGAQVLASGNILVLGRLSGLAHAGVDGDERAVIIGFDLRPTQVRIGKKIAIAPDRTGTATKRAASPEIAWVSGEEIVIEDYRGRLPG